MEAPSAPSSTRQFSFEGQQQHQHLIQVDQSAGAAAACAADSTGLTVWPVGLALCEHLAAHPGLVEGKRTLELGCGAGLPGLLALALGAAHVTFADREQPVSGAEPEPRIPGGVWEILRRDLPPLARQVLAQVRRSAALNGFSAARADAQLYDWERPAQPPGGWAGAWRLVVAADVVYASRTARPLAAALRALLHPTEGVALVAHQERRAVSLDPATRLPRVDTCDEP